MKPDFETFWKVYPRKVAKGAARKVFAKINPDEALFDKIIKAVELQSLQDQWRKDKGQFIPHPATWLNQERWDDEIDIKINFNRPVRKCCCGCGRTGNNSVGNQWFYDSACRIKVLGW